MDWTGNGDFIGRSCEDGKAKPGGTSSRNNAGEMTWRPANWRYPADVVAELDLLLTGGRLNNHTTQVVADAYTQRRDQVSSCAVTPSASPPCMDALRLAQVMIISSAEFQSTNANRPSLKPRTPTPKVPSQSRAYKAIVLIHLNGGADSWNMIMPHSGCTGEHHLHA
jgi:hypothetical protein